MRQRRRLDCSVSGIMKEIKIFCGAYKDYEISLTKNEWKTPKCQPIDLYLYILKFENNLK